MSRRSGPTWNSHRDWLTELGRETLAALLAAEAYEEIAKGAIRVESRTNLPSSFSVSRVVGST
jgi:hypothetical protein